MEHYSLVSTNERPSCWSQPLMLSNADDVLKHTTNEGKVKFTPAYNDDPAVLTLNGATINSWHQGAS